MADIYGLGHVVVGKELFLEGQYVAEAVEGFLHAFDAAFLPCPKVGRDIMYRLEATLVCPRFNLEVEAGIVYTDNHVGLETCNVAFAETDVAQHSREVHDHLDEAHEGQIADVTHGRATLGGHRIATPEAELGLWVTLAQGTHEHGAIHVARSLACYDIVFHLFIYNKMRLEEVEHESDESDEQHNDECAGDAQPTFLL